VIDHNKLRRAQESVIKELDAKFEDEIHQNGISCIFIGGYLDETKVMLKAEENAKCIQVWLKKSILQFAWNQEVDICGIFFSSYN